MRHALASYVSMAAHKSSLNENGIDMSLKIIRIIRIFAGLIAAWQVLGLLPVVTWLQNLDGVNGSMWATVFIKLLVLLLAGGTYFWLGKVKNRIGVDTNTSEGHIIALSIFTLLGAGVILAIALPAFQDHKNLNVVNSNPTSASIVPPATAPQLKDVTPPINPDQVVTSVSQQTHEDKEILRKQGIGGNQEISDVTVWGDAQLIARSFQGDNLIKARSFSMMWQRQIIQKNHLSPERALFLGYSIVLNYLDQEKALCRPDISKNGGIEDMSGEESKAYPECFKYN